MSIIRFRPLLEKLSAQDKADDVKDEKEYQRDKKNALTPMQSKELARQKKIKDMFENSNRGNLKADAVKQLAAQIEKNDIRYEGFPEWVLKSWLDPNQKGAIPLLNNRWLDVKSIVSEENDNDFEIGKRVYAGLIVNHARKSETGVKAINLLQCKDLDLDKMQKILTFERAGIEANKLIDRKNKDAVSAGGTVGESPNPIGGNSPDTDANAGSGAASTPTSDLGGATPDTGVAPAPIAGATPVGGATAPTSGTGTVPASTAAVPTDSTGSPDLSNLPSDKNK